MAAENNVTVDNYMALDDIQTLWTNTLKPWILQNIHSYTDVYIGVAAASSTVIDNAYHHDNISAGRPITFTNASGYLWIVMPATYSPVAMMNGIEVPMALDSTTTISSKSYKVWESTNQYSGTFNIYLM